MLGYAPSVPNYGTPIPSAPESCWFYELLQKGVPYDYCLKSELLDHAPLHPTVQHLFLVPWGATGFLSSLHQGCLLLFPPGNQISEARQPLHPTMEYPSLLLRVPLVSLASCSRWRPLPLMPGFGTSAPY